MKGALAKLSTAAGQLREFVKDILDEKTHQVVRQELAVAAEINIVLLGIGGSGKTSIVRALAAMSKANPAISTGEIELYALASDVAVLRQEKVKTEGKPDTIANVKQKTRVKMNLLDTVGQYPERLVTNGLINNEAPTIIVLVIDLFAATIGVEHDSLSPTFDKDRIKKQEALWSVPHLKALLANGHLGRIVGSVVFVNKVDLLNLTLGDASTLARRVGNTFAASLQSVAHWPTPSVVVGSAALGWGVSGFRDNRYHSIRSETLLETIIRLVREA